MIYEKFNMYCQLCDIRVCPICHFNDKSINPAEYYVCNKCDQEHGIEFIKGGDQICFDFPKY